MRRSPTLPFAILLLIAWTTLTIGGGIVQAGGTSSLDAIVESGIVWAIPAAALLVLVVSAFGGWRQAIGLTRPAFGRSLLVPLVVVGLLMVTALQSGLPSSAVAASLLLNSLAVGISEELMFRGVLLAALIARMGVRRGVIVSAIAFGGVHSLNALLTGEPLQAVSQSLIAIGMGFWAADLRLRSGSLLVPILLHAAWDFALFVSLHTGQPSQIAIVAGVALVGTIALGVRAARGLSRLEGSALDQARA